MRKLCCAIAIIAAMVASAQASQEPETERADRAAGPADGGIATSTSTGADDVPIPVACQHDALLTTCEAALAGAARTWMERAQIERIRRRACEQKSALAEAAAAMEPQVVEVDRLALMPLALAASLGAALGLVVGVAWVQ